MNARWSLLFAAMVMVTGCTKDATQVIVTIDAERGVRLDAAQLHLVVLGGVGRTTAPTASRFDRVLAPGVGDHAYPFELALAPLDGDVGRSYSVTATAETDTGTFVGQVRIIGGYVEGETTTVRLLLEDACRTVVCGDEQTCKTGACVDAHTRGEVDAGMADAGERDARTEDAGQEDGGGVDAGMPDAGPDDAGMPDAGALDAAVDAGDVVECILGIDDCDRDPAAVCTDTPASFTCACPASFTGSGHGASGCLLTDPSLVSLVPSTGTLSPAFAGPTTMYTLALPPGTTSGTLTPTVGFPWHATVVVNGSIVASGSASAALTAGLAPTPVTVVVTTDFGATRTYTIVLVRSATYVKASNTNGSDRFGYRLALSSDGSTLAVGARGEASNATGIGGNQADNSAVNAGAVYVFTRAGSAWSQQAYIKASNTNANDSFGTSLVLSSDGSTLAVGASLEASNATGIDGNQADNSAPQAGAVYVFTRAGSSWSQQAYLKASNTNTEDLFGCSLALSAGGSTLAVGAKYEDSNATGIGGDQADNTTYNAGAVYVFTRAGVAWSQQAYVKASNTDGSDYFGLSVALSSDGSTLAVGTDNEDSNATGINGNQADNSARSAGAVYVFTRVGSSWSQQAYVKASNTNTDDSFAESLALSSDGYTLAVGASGEESNATGIGGDQTNNSAVGAGAVYIY